jgi:hypothetical protein
MQTGCWLLQAAQAWVTGVLVNLLICRFFTCCLFTCGLVTCCFILLQAAQAWVSMVGEVLRGVGDFRRVGLRQMSGVLVLVYAR